MQSPVAYLASLWNIYEQLSLFECPWEDGKGDYGSRTLISKHLIVEIPFEIPLSIADTI